MKFRLLVFSYILLFACYAFTQTKMRVVLRSGQTVEYGIDEIEEVHFSTEDESSKGYGAFKIAASSSSLSRKGFCESASIMVTAEQMNSVYSALNVSKDEFVRDYEFVSSVVYHGEEGDKTYKSTQSMDNFVSYDANASVGGISTTGLTWIMSAKYRREHQGECPSATAVFVKNLGSASQHIVVLNIGSNEALPIYSSSDKYQLSNQIESYWKEDAACNNERVAQVNIFVPSIGEEDENKAVYAKDLQELFSEPLCDGVKLNISSDYKAGKNNIISNDVELRMKSASCPGYNIMVSNNGKEIVCEGQTVAVLTGNTVSLNKDSEIAKAMLNTNELYLTFSFKATYTTSCTGTCEIPNTGYPSFIIRFVSPVKAMKPSAGHFEDGLDFGTTDFNSYHTTIMRASDMVKITDWRGYDVVEGSYLWSYYGIKRVTCDNSKIATDVSGQRVLLKDLINTVGKQIIKAGIVDAVAWNDSDLRPGLSYTFGQLGISESDTYDKYFYYKNNGAVLNSEFHLYFPITIEYTWGTMTKEIQATVKPTQHINVKGE